MLLGQSLSVSYLTSLGMHLGDVPGVGLGTSLGSLLGMILGMSLGTSLGTEFLVKRTATPQTINGVSLGT